MAEPQFSSKATQAEPAATADEAALSKPAPLDRLQREAQRFDPAALTALLTWLRYPVEKQELRSYFTSGFRAAAVAELSLADHATVTLNVGLCPAQNPLSAELYTEASRNYVFREFLNSLEHPLLAQRLAGLYPERDPRLVPDYSGLRRGLLTLQRPHTPAGLHWLFRLIYPELGVQVTRDLSGDPMRSPGIVLDQSQLGTAALGGAATLPCRGYLVILSVDEFLGGPEEASGAQCDWSAIVWRRLKDQIAPLVAETGIWLTLELVQWPASLRLNAPALGWEPLGDDENVSDCERIGQGAARVPPSVTIFQDFLKTLL